ncbi:MAG: hypothetical protein E7057_09305 [Lentisphaerae bacterium]|nr:hypothetical protein [Lentisphaerota bacterium]
MKRRSKVPRRLWYYPNRKASVPAEQDIPDNQEAGKQSRAKKFPLKSLALILLILTAIVFFDQLLCFAFIRIGSMATGLDLRADKVELSITDGHLKITNLRIHDPRNTAGEQMLELPLFYIRWDNQKLLNGKLFIPEINLRNLQLSGEISSDGKLNLQNLFYPLFQLSEDMDDFPLDIRKIQISNIFITISDRRLENNIDGTGFYLRSLNISPERGVVDLNGFQMFPPHDHRNNILKINNIKLMFAPDMINSAPLILKEADVSGVRMTAGFNDCESVIKALTGTFKHFSIGSGNDSEIVWQLKNFIIRNVSLNCRDIHSKNSIHGFGINFEECSGSLTEGNIHMKNLTVTNPQGYNREMLGIGSLSVDFRTESIFSNIPQIDRIRADKINAVAEIKEENRTNIAEINIALKNFIARINPDTAIENDESKIFIPEIKNFQFTNAELSILDGRKDHRAGSFSICFKEVAGSPEQGTIKLKELQVSSPAGCDKDMLKIKSAEAEYIPGIFTAGQKKVIRNISINGLSATAGLKDPETSNINEAAAAVELLLSPFISNGELEVISADTDVPEILNSELKNCQFSIRDYRKENNVDGFSVGFAALSYSKNTGFFTMNNLLIANPRTYTRPNLLTAAGISAKLNAANNKILPKELEINKMHGCLEYRNQDNCNIHDVADALCILFKHPLPCKNNAVESDYNRTAQYTIDILNVKDSSVTVLNPAQHLSLTKPYSEKQKNVSFESSDAPLLTSIHDQTAELEAGCKSIQTLQMLTFLDSTTDPSRKLLKKTYEAGREKLKKKHGVKTHFFKKFLDFLQ